MKIELATLLVVSEKVERLTQLMIGGAEGEWPAFVAIDNSRR